MTPRLRVLTHLEQAMPFVYALVNVDLRCSVIWQSHTLVHGAMDFTYILTSVHLDYW